MEAGQALTDNLVLVAPIGSGAMGAVWKAQNQALQSYVAVKILRRAAGSEQGRQRFEQEARGVAKLDHPHIVRVFDLGMTEEGDPFLVMELLAGEDLASRLDRLGRLDVASTVELVTQVAKALTRASAEGVVHRDIKPANLFLLAVEGAEQPAGELFVKVLDFGVARFTRETSLTQTGALIGTPLFMSPEQFTGNVVDHRADLWSLAVVAYRCLTSALPFAGDTPIAVGMAVCSGDFAPVTRSRPELPPGLDEFFRRALAVDPHQRFQTARELAEALRLSVSVRPAPVHAAAAPAAATAGYVQPALAPLTLPLAAAPIVKVRTSNPGPADVVGPRAGGFSQRAGVLVALVVIALAGAAAVFAYALWFRHTSKPTSKSKQTQPAGTATDLPLGTTRSDPLPSPGAAPSIPASAIAAPPTAPPPDDVGSGPVSVRSLHALMVQKLGAKRRVVRVMFYDEFAVVVFRPQPGLVESYLVRQGEVGPADDLNSYVMSMDQTLPEIGLDEVDVGVVERAQQDAIGRSKSANPTLLTTTVGSILSAVPAIRVTVQGTRDATVEYDLKGGFRQFNWL